MLTDRKIRAEKPSPKRTMLWDQRGLYLLSPRTGASSGASNAISACAASAARSCWRWDPIPRSRSPRPAGARRRRGNHPPGGDPLAEKLARRAKASLRPVESVAALAREWHRHQAPRWSPGYAAAVSDRLERLVFPMLGKLHVNDVTAPLMLASIRQIEARGHRATAHIVRQHMDAVFAFAIAAGIGNSNPAAHIKKAVAPAVSNNLPAVLTLDGVRRLLRRIEADPGYPPTKLALLLLAITACRPSEVIGAAWLEFEHLNGVGPMWRIPAPRMKTRVEHIVPLPAQAVAIIETLRPLSGHLDLLFPNSRPGGRPISRRALRCSLPLRFPGPALLARLP